MTAGETLERVRAALGGLAGDDPAEAVERLVRDLAECYRLTGADPDEDEDWRLTLHAVEEVRALRSESDRLEGLAEDVVLDPTSGRKLDALRNALLVCGGVSGG